MCAYDAWGLLSSSYPTTVTMEHTCPYYSCYPQHLPNEALLGRYDCCACDASGRISFPTIIATLEHKQMPLPLPPPHLPMKLHSVRTAYKSYGTTCFFLTISLVVVPRQEDSTPSCWGNMNTTRGSKMTCKVICSAAGDGVFSSVVKKKGHMPVSLHSPAACCNHCLFTAIVRATCTPIDMM